LCAADLSSLPGYAFVDTEVRGREALVSRTGYTGEDGFEVMVAAEVAELVWEAVAASESGARPCGLGARDTLRTEAGFALYGHDIDQSINPYEARLGWVVSSGSGKPSFVGRAALAQIKAAGPVKKLVGLRVEPGGVPRPGLPILHDAQQIGHVTSGTFSPTLRQNIAIGYVPVALSDPGRQLAIEMRGRPASAEVVALPFVPHHSRPRAKM
jgi:aminomethyltransferase